MLEEGNAAMVELARDYKRQQAIIEKYRNEDTSLQSFSQLTQSQPTKQQLQQQQQLQLQQLQLLQQSPGQQQQQVWLISSWCLLLSVVVVNSVVDSPVDSPVVVAVVVWLW